MHSGARLRQLFSTLLLFCAPTEPDSLWLQFRQHICDDLPYRLRCMGITNATDSDIYDYGLY
ncbi:hypothetical protein K525DRAFT_153629, partial [Schizophyllum commune Loenen D]